jgi:hypothetical protein
VIVVGTSNLSGNNQFAFGNLSLVLRRRKTLTPVKGLLPNNYANHPRPPWRTQSCVQRRHSPETTLGNQEVALHFGRWFQPLETARRAASRSCRRTASVRTKRERPSSSQGSMIQVGAVSTMVSCAGVIDEREVLPSYWRDELPAP